MRRRVQLDAPDCGPMDRLFRGLQANGKDFILLVPEDGHSEMVSYCEIERLGFGFIKGARVRSEAVRKPRRIGLPVIVLVNAVPSHQTGRPETDISFLAELARLSRGREGMRRILRRLGTSSGLENSPCQSRC